jgi:hypothetical protein
MDLMKQDVQVLVPASMVESTSRNDWRVQVSSAKLAAQSQQRAQYHEQRLTWWKDEEAKAREAIRDSGVEYREQQVTGGERFEAIIDPSLSRRLSECGQKINNHRSGADEYLRWAAFLAAMNGVALTLSREDFHYFQPKPPGAE